MKRLIIVTTLLLLTATVWASPAPAPATLDYCSDVTDTCWPIARGAYTACMDQGGSYQQCWCREQRAANACRAQFGCPPLQSEQAMIDAGCGPD